MAAEIRLHVYTGTDAGTDGGSAASFSFLSTDSAADDQATRVSYPITIPTSGCAYSYEKWISACVSVAPDNNVSNFQVWGTPPAQAFPTGTCWLVGTADFASGSTPTDTSSSIATSSLADATSDSKYAWDSASYAAAGSMTDYLVSQLQVTTTATAGDWGPCDLAYSYDEV
jgi:hypothetical protein